MSEVINMKLTKKEYAQVIKAAGLAEKYSEMSCFALAIAATGEYENLYCDLVKKYKAFYDEKGDTDSAIWLDKKMEHYFGEKETERGGWKDLRVLMLLSFAEACK